ncbi:MAG TPA: hypothetical protein DIT05_12590 [Morganella sp. (in: Bacteria)]|nr:hypothetical protein [Morganella sp. (in: enterobacteria)]
MVYRDNGFISQGRKRMLPDTEVRCKRIYHTDVLSGSLRFIPWEIKGITPGRGRLNGFNRYKDVKADGCHAPDASMKMAFQ